MSIRLRKHHLKANSIVRQENFKRKLNLIVGVHWHIFCHWSGKHLPRQRHEISARPQRGFKTTLKYFSKFSCQIVGKSSKRISEEFSSTRFPPSSSRIMIQLAEILRRLHRSNQQASFTPGFTLPHGKLSRFNYANHYFTTKAFKKLTENIWCMKSS